MKFQLDTSNSFGQETLRPHRQTEISIAPPLQLVCEGDIIICMKYSQKYLRLNLNPISLHEATHGSSFRLGTVSDTELLPKGASVGSHKLV